MWAPTVVALGFELPAGPSIQPHGRLEGAVPAAPRCAPYDRAVNEHEGEVLPVNFRMDVPPEEMGGRYANFLAVWHTGHEFTLDFAATQPPHPEDLEEGESPVVVPCHVVARVRIPVSVVFDVLRALNENMTRYEQTYGEIHRPEPRGGQQQQ